MGVVPGTDAGFFSYQGKMVLKDLTILLELSVHNQNLGFSFDFTMTRICIVEEQTTCRLKLIPVSVPDV